MYLSDYLDINKLENRLEDGYISARKHSNPNIPLVIYSYTKKAQYNWKWDDVIRKCRGLIVNYNNFEIVSRPYEKFFEIGQHPETAPLTVRDMDANFGPPIITEKVNGCLGIFWKYQQYWGIATKGSFESPHALWATKWLEDHVEQSGPLVFPEGYTPVFEIICQEIQPHVIKYLKDELILLDFINNETGEELRGQEFSEYPYKNKLRFSRQYFPTFEEALKTDNNLMEGYVASWTIPGQPPFKVKIKFPTFKENRKKFYQELRNIEIESKAQNNAAEYGAIRKKAADIVIEALKTCTTRKEFADYFNSDERKQCAAECFRILDYDGKEKDAIIIN